MITESRADDGEDGERRGHGDEGCAREVDETVETQRQHSRVTELMHNHAELTISVCIHVYTYNVSTKVSNRETLAPRSRATECGEVKMDD